MYSLRMRGKAAEERQIRKTMTAMQLERKAQIEIQDVMECVFANTSLAQA